MRALRTITAAALALGAATALHTNVRAYSTYAHWVSSPVTFYVNPVNQDVPQADAIAALQTGMDVWNTQSGTSFRYQYGGTVNDTATAYDNRNVIMFRNTSNGSAIATTYSWWNANNELLDSDIVFWDGPFTFFTGSTACGVVPNAAYIEDIAAHELGHALGMNHSSVAEATMYPSYSYCSMQNRTLAADDIAGVQTLYRVGSPAPATNTAPTVSITSPKSGASYANGATVSFSGSASDTQDGALTASMTWTSNIDGTIGTGGSFSQVLSAGTHTITATVMDSGNLPGSAQVSVTVAAAATPQPLPPAPSPSAPSLSAVGRKVKGYEKVDLSWKGLSTASTDVYRNSSKAMTTANDGSETDPINKKGAATYTYKVCDAGTTNCSNTVTVTF